MNCIDCLETDLVFEGENEYEPDPETGEPRCFSCDLKANPERYADVFSYWIGRLLYGPDFDDLSRRANKPRRRRK